MTRTLKDARLEVFNPGNNALDFSRSGDGDYVSTNASATDLGIDGAKTKTITAWVKPADGLWDISGMDAGVWEIGTQSTSEEFSLRAEGGPEGKFKAQLWSTDFSFNSGTGEGEAVLLALVYDGGDVIAYANGEEKARSTVSLNTGDGKNFRVGEWANDHWDGIIDDVRVYDTNLSSSQLTDLYNGVDVTSDLVLHFKFDDGSGTTATDSAGSNDGTVTGSPQWVAGIAPDHVATRADIQRVEATPRLQSVVDQHTVTLHDNSQAYVGNVTSGDRIEFSTQLDGENSLTRRWTGLVRNPTPREMGAGKQELSMTIDSFVFGVLDIREATNAFTDTAISGNTDAILETILTNNAEEIDQSKIKSVSTNADVSWSGKSLLECVKELAERGDALVAGDDQALVFKRLDEPTPKWTLQDSDRGLAAAPTIDDRLANEVIVEGGEDTNVDDEQPTQSSTTTVTDSNRIQHRLTLSKSQVTLVEVYTKTTGSGDNVVIRIHPDNGSGSPIDVSDREQDIARRTLTSPFLSSDGFTSFLLPDHRLAPKEDPWLLIESDGSTGQDVGTDGSGTPTYKAHYPFTLNTRVQQKDSIDTYRRRETSLRAPEAKTKALTEQRGEAALRHRAEPEQELQFPAESNRAFDLSPGDVITVDEPHLNASGDFIVTQLRDVYAGDRNELSTTVTTQDVTTV